MTTSVSALEPVSAAPIRPVVRPLLRMRWTELTYVHWAVLPETVAAQLPPGLEPDTFAGRAWVGLIPFRMAGIGVGRRGPRLPRGTFPETNVRTYVVGPDGGRGVYFHSLDITSLPPTAVARLGYQLPYCWSSMRVAHRGDEVAYLTRRRWPRPSGARSLLRVELGDPVGSAVTPLDHFLTARWSLYAVGPRGAVLRAHVEHAPWPLREARPVHLRDELTAAAGYADLRAREPDHVRFGGDVEVLVGPPTRVG
jgi:uncharacterized protein